MAFSKVLRRAAFVRKLKRLPKVARKLIRKAVAESADEMVSLMKSLVPVSPGGGTLRDSIDWTWGKPPPGVISLGEVVSTDVTLTATIFAGSPLNRAERKGAFYARWVEHGTVQRTAQPYFFVSYRALRGPAKRRISRSFTKAAKLVARR